MKIAMIGNGKMGQAVQRIARDRGHEICCVIEQNDWESPDAMERLDGADVCIEFTHPDSVLENIQHLTKRKKNTIVGTTGWNERLGEVEQLVKSQGIGLLHSSNFSIGMHLFRRLIRKAAEEMTGWTDYDVALEEIHHNQKKDAPSGSAKDLISILTHQLSCKEDELSVTSTRVGHVPGTHRVIFDSLVDSITLTHEARSRDGFALGAVQAAEWLQGKSGLYTLDDLFN